MTFNPNIPQSTDIPSQSQAQFLTNFTQLNTVFGQDHITFNDATTANRGKHDQSTYVEQGSDPTTLTNENAVYSKDTGTQPDLFYRPQSNGTAVRLTGGGLTAAAWVSFRDGNPPTNVVSYNATPTFVSSGSYTITFARAFSSSDYVVVINGYQTGTGDNLNRKVNISSKAAGSITFNVTRPETGAASPYVYYDCVFFGTLA